MCIKTKIKTIEEPHNYYFSQLPGKISVYRYVIKNKTIPL